MSVLKKKKETHYSRPSDVSCFVAFKEGNILTKLSFLICGLGYIVNKQFIRGLIFLAIEVGYLMYMISFGINSIGDFITLGTLEQGQVYNEALGIYEYSSGDNSMLCLLYGVITFFLTAVMIFIAFMSDGRMILIFTTLKAIVWPSTFM